MTSVISRAASPIDAIASGTAPVISIKVEPQVVRWHPLVRFFLCIPHLLWTGALQLASVLVSFVIAGTVLATGRVPVRLGAFQVLCLRERVRCYAYFFVLRSLAPPLATEVRADDPGDDPLVVVFRATPPVITDRASVVRRPVTLLGHLVVLIPLGVFLDLLYPVWMAMLVVNGRWPHRLLRLVLEVERWVGALVLYVTYASDVRPPFGLAAYRAPTHT